MKASIRALCIIFSTISLISACSSSDEPDIISEHSKTKIHHADIASKSNDVIIANTPYSLSVWKKNQDYPHLQLQRHIGEEKIKDLSISADGSYAIISGYNTITLWGLNTGKTYATWHMPSNIIDTSISEDGQHALIGLDDKTARLVNLHTGIILKTLKHNHQIRQVAISNDGKYALTSDDNQTAKLWGLRRGSLLHVWLQGQHITAIALSDNNQYAMTTSNDGKIKIWSIQSGKLAAQFKVSPIEIISAALSGKGKYAAIAASPQTLQLWNLNNYKLIKSWQLPKKSLWQATTTKIHDIEFNPEESILSIEDEDGNHSKWSIPE